MINPVKIVTRFECRNLPKRTKLLASLLTVAGLLFVAACQTVEPRTEQDALDLRWAQAQEAYQSTLSVMIELRRPCVLEGPDAPGCIIDDREYLILEPIRQQVRAALDDYERFGKLDALLIAERALIAFGRSVDGAR